MFYYSIYYNIEVHSNVNIFYVYTEANIFCQAPHIIEKLSIFLSRKKVAKNASVRTLYKKYVLNVVKHLNLCKKMQSFWFFWSCCKGTYFGRPEGLLSAAVQTSSKFSPFGHASRRCNYYNFIYCQCIKYIG